MAEKHSKEWTIFIVKNDGTYEPLAYVVPEIKIQGDGQDEAKNAGIVE